MSTSTEPEPIGDVHCLNCGRALADVILDEGDGRLHLRPTLNQSNVQVIVAGRRLLRCRRCGGRAFVEIHEETPIEQIATEQPVAEVATVVAAPRSAVTAERARSWRVSSPERGRARGLSRAPR